MIKKIAFSLTLLLLLVGIGIYFLFSNMDSLVHAAIEKYGTEATQTAVKLDRVKILLKDGTAEISGLTVGNPKEFSDSHAIYLGKIFVKIDTGSVTGSGPIVIQDILVENPQILHEINNKGESNLQQISQNTQAYASKYNKLDQQQKSESKSTAAAQGRNLIINHLAIKKGQVAVSQPMFGGKTFFANIPDIHLSNIGKNSGGTTPAEVTQNVIGSITDKAVQASSANIAKEIGASINIKKDDVIDQTTKELGVKIQGLFK